MQLFSFSLRARDTVFLFFSVFPLYLDSFPFSHNSLTRVKDDPLSHVTVSSPLGIASLGIASRSFFLVGKSEVRFLSILRFFFFFLFALFVSFSFAIERVASRNNVVLIQGIDGYVLFGWTRSLHDTTRLYTVRLNALASRLLGPCNADGAWLLLLLTALRYSE